MKNTIIFSAIVIASFLGACKSNSPGTKSGSDSSQSFKLDTSVLKTGETYYQCSMHPDQISDKPGQCPVCGDELVEMKKK